MKKGGGGLKPKDAKAKAKHVEGKIAIVGKYLKLGLTVNSSARAAGMNPVTLYRWKDYAAEGREPYATYWVDFEESISIGQAVLAGTIYNAARKDWRAASWILERRHPEDWGKKENVGVGILKETLADATKLSDAELNDKIEKLSKEINED